MDLSNKHYVIVGGSSGMGKATAKEALRYGASVEIVSRDPKKLKVALAELDNKRATAEPLDMTNEEAVKGYFANKPNASIDALIISASTAVHGKFVDAKTADIERMFGSKFMGPFRVAREAIPKLRRGASITFFSGALSRRPSTNGAGLAAVNAAVEGLSRALALELGPDIRVNTLSPGMTKTEAYADMPSDARTRMFENVAKTLPLQRVAEADEIAQAALFLSSSPFTTGHVLDIDGGYLIQQ